MSSFTHLHLHTQYSLLDGAIRISQLPGALKEKGYDACAITDHGNLYGAVEFHNTMRKAGLKPIIGMEAYVAVGHRTLRSYDRPGPNAEHLVLLCQNREGYRNLIRMASQGFIEGKYYGVPRIDRELLEQHNEGLIALSACLGGVVNRKLLRGEDEAAREAAQWYGQVFDGRFYLEIQNHAIEEESRVNPKLLEMATEFNLPLVGTNDCHYLTPEEAYPHYLLQLMGWQKRESDPNTEPFTDHYLYLKDPDEMAKAMEPFPSETLTNAASIAEQCDLDLTSKTFYLPKFEIPPEKTEQKFFSESAHQGLRRRFEQLEPLYEVSAEEQESFRQPYLDRLDFELDVINRMEYSGYFLIVADFINWAKDNGVRVGPGRGSGAGSLVAFAMRITDLDPLRHGLLFERFLNPERVSLPDFDIDFDVQGRERVIEYVRQKYGEEKVCQISTFGSLGAKAALRNVARVLDFPYSQADKIAKLIPNILNISLQEAIQKEPELARLQSEGEENEKKLIANGIALEGLNSNLSTHAAGVIIMDQDIQEIMPVCTPAKGEGIQSMYSMKYAEDQGAVKFDFLGLLNLTIIEKAMELVKATHPDSDLDIDNVHLDDEETFKLLSRGDTTGVFQLESGGMRRLLMDMKPESFEDVVAILALYRPGPLESGMVASFVRRKNGQEPVAYLHPLLEESLKETYGVMVYQEQVIQAARVLAGYSLGEADLLRRAIGKKIAEEMAQQRNKFVDGCKERGIDEEKATEIFDQIDYFSGYGFNKSHSAAYGLIAYQTAYLKAHYPVEFMAALLSSVMDNTDKVVNFIADCRDMGVDVLPPDINRSSNSFTIDDGAVRFGLEAVKNVGGNAVDVILKARDAQPNGEFADLSAFVKSVDFHKVNKRVLEALIKCGGFDSIEPNRAQLLDSVGQMVSLGLSFQSEQVVGQETLFDLLGEEETAKIDVRVDLEPRPDFQPKQRLRLEKEALGFYISGHPLDRYRSESGGLAVTTHDLWEQNHADGSEVALAGVVAQMSLRMTKKAEKFAILRLEDLRGSIEVVVFPRLYAEVADLLKEDEPLLIWGRVRINEDDVSMQGNKVMSLARYREEQARRCTVLVQDTIEDENLRRMAGVMAKFPGDCQLGFRVETNNDWEVWVDGGLQFRPCEQLMEELETTLPDLPVYFVYDKLEPTTQNNGSSQSRRPQ